jgi:6-pyruvoyltetrahydropterin/6-carboxytetrahydropterin synthase
MYLIKVEYHFDSAHFLAGYAGKCANIHGHRWVAEVEVGSDTLIEEGPKRGMVVDFSDLKKDLKALLEIYDHALIIEEGTMRKETLQCLTEDGFKIAQVGFRPTAENFSFSLYKSIKEKGYPVKRVTVHESPNSSAIYESSEVE